jgi:hypothetical protein
MNAIQVERRVLLRPGTGTEHVARDDLTQLFVVAGTGDFLSEAHGRTGPAGDVVLFRQPEEFNHVHQIISHWLVNPQRLARRDHDPRLLQVRPAIDAFQQDAVNFLTQLFNAVDDLQTMHFTQLLRETFHSVGRSLEVGRTAWNPATTRQPVLFFGSFRYWVKAIT